jgi:hypothetical protein
MRYCQEGEMVLVHTDKGLREFFIFAVNKKSYACTVDTTFIRHYKEKDMFTSYTKGTK